MCSINITLSDQSIVQFVVFVVRTNGPHMQKNEN